MKIRTLFLKAFGPFTERTLDFSGPANLHLIYGANEAGKSSALRAMGDLRYGIPARSADNFVHEFKDMRLAGCFEDVAGRAVGLVRRKGHHDTLLQADPLTGAALAGAPVSPEVLLALTGGVAREQFETMYGLDSAHLRRGGQLLIQGEGELGAALFEASTGSAGIRQMLDTLQLDAKKFFIPRGQLPILNESVRQLDDARHRYKQAVTKPDQWKTLKRAHEEAQGHLAGVRTALAGRRARLAELAELRAVEPLLHKLALTAQAWTQVQHHMALPPEAGERRRQALQQRASAHQAWAEAQAALEECRAAAQALRIEPLLLSHASAIDRLVADLALVRHGRDERIRLQAAADSQAGQLLLQAAQIMGPGSAAPALDEFFRRAPSAADQAELVRLLDESKSLTQALAHAQERQSASGRKLALYRREVVAAPAPPLQQALSLALGQAQALGDAPRRLADLQAALDTEQRRLAQTLADLGLESIRQLTASRWLASAEIDGYEHARRDLQQQAASNQGEFKKLQADLVAQQRRHKSLCATGEVVTAETLRQARAERDEGWQSIRGAFIDRPLKMAKPAQDAAGHSPAHEAYATLSEQAQAQDAPEQRQRAFSSDLPQAFERAQAQADRQADLLREGAKRAAEMAECEQRMADMTRALAELQHAKDAQAQALAALDAAWQQTLKSRAIPQGTAAVVREWLALRQSALERHERLTEAGQAHAVLTQQIHAATESLRAALQALALLAPQGEPQQGASQHGALARGHLAQGDMPWQSLMTLGIEADRRLLAQRAALEERASAMATLAQDIEEDQASVARLAQLFQACQSALDEKARLLYLPEGTAAGTLKARLAELQCWVQDYQRHAECLQQVRAMKDSEEAAISGASALGQLLREPVGDYLEAWLDALALRLAQTREALQIKEERERREAEEFKRQQRAQLEMQTAEQVLAQLMAQADVSQLDDLPEAENRSDQRRDVAERLQELQDQLARTSQKDADRLRAEIAGLDSSAIDTEKQTCAAQIARLEADEKAAIEAEQSARAALARVDTSDEAAQAREAMEAAIARYRAGVRPWAQLKLAEALLGEALRRHREKAQGPVVALAGEYFRLMTGGRFVRLVVDADSAAPVLLAQPVQGQPMGVAALSEGTADQLYLALRLAALEVQRKPERMMPLVLDDVFMTADDERAIAMFRALEKFAATTQVMVFTHHRHLLDLAAHAVAGQGLRIHQLASVLERQG